MTFSVNQVVDATTINNQFRSAYDNSHKLTASDLSSQSLKTKNLIKPDPIFDFNFNFTSGQIRQTKWGSEKFDYQYITSHVKQSYFTDRTSQLIIMGHEVVLPRSSYAIVQATGNIISLTNTVLDDNGDANRFNIFIDGTNQGETLTYNFDSDGVETGGSPTFDAMNSARILPFSTYWSGPLDGTTHQIDLVADAWLEQTTLINMSLITEIRYYAG